MNLRPCLVVLPILLALPAHAQWKERRLLGKGGEASIATDGKGNLYATSHQPAVLYVSHDWGASWGDPTPFPDAMCDLHVIALPNGRMNVSYIKNGVTGLVVWGSNDFGNTLDRRGFVEGPLDREWMASNPVNGELYMDYSKGYIGGPKSEGVFLVASTDGGKTFTLRSRIDKEPQGNYPVDPYLSISTDGRIYAMWNVSKDMNTIDSFNFAYSTDGGKTFQGHTTIATFHKNLGDTQERWMLGCIIGVGKSTVVATYPDYSEMTVDGKTTHPFLQYYRVSNDGGKTWSDPKTVSSQKEIEGAIREFAAVKKDDSNDPYYIQTLGWGCADPKGRVHLAWQDNRVGQTQTDGRTLSQWHVRFATALDLGKGFGPSERVSEDVACGRPPLDFLSVAADDNRAYIIWTETPNSAPKSWNFSGDLWVARKILPASLGD